MNTPTFYEDQYLTLLENIIDYGEDRGDRTGTGTRAIFGATLRIALDRGFPLLTTKKVPFKAVASELLWFIEGSGDERRLAEIHHGTRDSSKKTIWSPNAEGTTGAKFQPKFPGDLGRVYGAQWRHWKQYSPQYTGATGHKASHYIQNGEVDQLADVIDKIKNKPTDRRIILSAWNPGELDEMALPPCHMFAQFYVSNDKKLSCQMYQRSVDSFLGLPFNIASYALLTHMIAQVTGTRAHQLIMQLGDTHIYSNHMDQVREQLKRDPRATPHLVFEDREYSSINDFTLADFHIEGYDPHPAISAPMAA